MNNFKLKIASRRSKLAMVQTLWVKDQLERNIPNLAVSYTHLRAHETEADLVCRLLLEKTCKRIA